MTDAPLPSPPEPWCGVATERRPEVAVVHRPGYDDWTFPKGKLKPGEHVIAAALREVPRRRAWSPSRSAASLPPVHYLIGQPAQAGRLLGGPGDRRGTAFTRGDEVDEVRWLPVDRAARRLT